MVEREFWSLGKKASETAKVTGVYKIKTNRVRKDGEPIFMHQMTAVGESGDNLSKIVSAVDAAALWKSMGKKGALPVKVAKASTKKKKSCAQIANDAEERCEERRAVKKAARKAPLKKKVASRAAASKPALRKAPVKKAPAKKAPARKPAAKKAPARKAPAKKAPARRKAAAKK